MRILSIAVLLGAAAMLGCGQGGAPMMSEKRAGPAAGQDELEQKPAAAKDAIPMARKVIYTAEVNLVAEDFDKAQARLKDLIQKEKGYLAQSEVGGTPGSPRWGRWKIRIPVERLDPFLAAVADLGELERSALDSRDVTEEFYDLDARVRNKKVEEDRLLKHLEKSTGKLEEILAVEKELSRVRDEIDRHQGRLRLLANLSDLTTISVKIQERKGYQPVTAPTYGTALARTFSGSINLMVEAVKALIMVVVAATPWLLVLALLALPLYRLRHKLRPAAAIEQAETSTKSEKTEGAG